MPRHETLQVPHTRDQSPTAPVVSPCTSCFIRNAKTIVRGTQAIMDAAISVPSRDAVCDAATARPGWKPGRGIGRFNCRHYPIQAGGVTGSDRHEQIEGARIPVRSTP